MSDKRHAWAVMMMLDKRHVVVLGADSHMTGLTGLG